MSKIGKKIISVPEGIKIEIKDGEIIFQNAKNEVLKFKILDGIAAKIEDKTVSFSAENDSLQTRANWGTIRSLANNAVIGLSQGFSKILEIEGIGYKAEKEGEDLVFRLGFSHPIKMRLPAGIKAEIAKNVLKISGFDKALVGKIAADIRNLKKPEPYKGKGIRYQGEIIKKKAGKKVEAVAGGAGAAK